METLIIMLIGLFTVFTVDTIQKRRNYLNRGK